MSIHESTKALYEDVFFRFEEAVKEGNTERAAKLREPLIEVMSNTIDDNARLTALLREAEVKLLAAGVTAG